MAVDYKVVVPIGIALIALVGFGGKASAKSKKSTPSKCPPYKIDREAVLNAARAALAQGVKGTERVASFVARTLYPVDVNGKAIAWPTQPPWALPLGAPEQLTCLWSEIILIISELDIPPEDPLAPKPSDVLNPLIADSPTPGKFFQLKNQSNPCPPGGSSKPSCWYGSGKNGIFAQALRKIDPTKGTEGQANNYIRLASQPGHWNINLYGRTAQTTSWPAYLKVDGRDIGTAWLPRHANAIASIIDGKYPPRTIDGAGKKVGSGSSYGLIWIPPIDPDAFRQHSVITVNQIEWPDGSSVLDPPPELLNLLTGVPGT